MKLTVLSGGAHPYDESTPVLESFLRDAGHEVTVTEDPAVLLTEKFRASDALVFNTRRVDDLTLTEPERTAMTQFIGGGKGFVCLHISTEVPETWPEYHDITGGGWVRGHSNHPAYGQLTVSVKNPSHPGMEGIDDFVTTDENYCRIAFQPGNDVFMDAEVEGSDYTNDGSETATNPLGWTRTYGNGKVFVNLLGHDGLSFQTPEFQQITLNGVDWVTSEG